MKESTTYLFAHDQRALYEDYLRTLANGQCLFSRQIPLYLSHIHEPDKMPLFSKHILGCQECQHKLKEGQNINRLIVEQIPYRVADQSFAATILPHVQEAENLIREKQQLQKELAKKKFLNTIKCWLRDLTVNLFFSKTFAAGLLLATLSFFILKLILN